MAETQWLVEEKLKELPCKRFFRSTHPFIFILPI